MRAATRAPAVAAIVNAARVHLATLLGAGPRAWALGTVAGCAYALVVGAITAMFPNPFFTRMTPAGPSNYAVWALSALLVGLVAATYASPRLNRACSVEQPTMAGSVLSVLAVGCPICNKIIVLLLGVGGALSYFQPVQPLLGALSLVVLGYALWLRLRPATLVSQPR